MLVMRDGAPRVAKLVALTALLLPVLPAVSAAAQSEPQPPPEVEGHFDVTLESLAVAFDTAPKSDGGAANLIVQVPSPEARAELESTPGVTVDPRSEGNLLSVIVSDPAALSVAVEDGTVAQVGPNERLSAFYPADPASSYDCSTQQIVAVTACAAVPYPGPEPDWSTSIWRDTAGAADVTIAIIDSGVIPTPDFAGRLAHRVTHICPEGIVSTHGTYVAQAAAGRGGDGYGWAGVDWNARILSYQVLGDANFDPLCDSVYGIDVAIRTAANDGADVINMSLGYRGVASQQTIDILQGAIDYAHSRGAIVVAAAGNEQLNTPGLTVYPAANAHVIAVGAVDPTGAPEAFSSRGSFVDVSAPNRHAIGPGVNDWLPGTSFAAPRVAGLIALMHSYNPNITEAQALSTLQSTIRPFNGDGTGMGTGIVSGTAAIAAMQTAPVCSSISSGYVLDGFGGLHSVGAAQSHPVHSNAYWPGWDIARGAALMPNDGGGYVVDAWGGIHPFGVGGGGSTPPATSSTAYWPGWDIVRDIAVLPNGTGGYLLDGWGGMHPFGIGGNPAPPMPVGTTYWPGWDVARSLVLTDTGGYVLDGWGGIHPFAIGAGGTTPPQLTGGPYWPGWDIARGIALTPGRAAGWLVDGWGGTHAMSAGGSADAKIRNTPYWTGWDIVGDVVTRDVC